jgi:hypothetical protein
MQNDGVAQEMASSPLRGSMVCGGDHPDPGLRNDTAVPLTIRHWPADRQEMAVSDDAGSDDDVQGDASSVHEEPSQSSTDVPTTAVQDELVGHDTPTRPDWKSDTVEPLAPSGSPNDWEGSQLPFRRV